MSALHPTRNRAAFEALRAQVRHRTGRGPLHAVEEQLALLEAAAPEEMLTYLGSWIAYAVHTSPKLQRALESGGMAELEVIDADTGAVEPLRDVPVEEALPSRMVVALLNTDMNTARILWDMAAEADVRTKVARSCLECAAALIVQHHTPETT